MGGSRGGAAAAARLVLGRHATLFNPLAGGGPGAEPWLRWFHYVFFGYLVKDLAIPLSTVLVAHHVVCLALTTASLLGHPLECAPLFVTTVTFLEAGSAILGYQSLFPKNRLLHRLCQVGMTLSNAASISLAVWYVRCYPVAMNAHYLFPIVGGSLVLARQQVEVARWSTWGKKPEKGA